MFKKLLTIMVAALLLALLLTPAALALEGRSGAAGVSLYLTRATACPGDSVAALGIVPDKNAWVSIKILSSTNEVVFFDATKSDAEGEYILTFKVPVPPVPPGTLVVVAGYGANVANQKLIVKDSINTKEITSVIGLPDVEVTAGTAREDIGLPAGVEVLLDDHSKEKVAVYWNNVGTAYDPNKTGKYTFEGTLVALEDIINPRALKATVNVIIKEAAHDEPGGTPGVPGGPVAPLPVGEMEIKMEAGGKVSEHGAALEIPANAFAEDLKIKIAVVAETGGLSLPEGGRLISEVLEITKDKEGDFTKPVAVTIKFDKSKVGSGAEITLCRYDSSAKAWLELDNIKIDWDKATISGETRHFTKFAVLAVAPVEVPPVAVILTDIAGHWAAEHIKTLVGKGILTGYPDQTFRPDKKITRAEFVAVLVKAFPLEDKDGKVFSDTVAHWAREAIAAAAAHGLVSGYSETAFGPDDPLTREQMAVMLVKAVAPAETTAPSAFSDEGQIASWAQGAVAAASENGLLTGYPDNTFRPQAQASRAEAATVLFKALK